MKLNLYSVSDKYIKYLRQFDDRIYDNKEENRIHERKYVGLVLTVNEFNYYIPMSSPKKSDYIDFIKWKGFEIQRGNTWRIKIYK